jgi:hypothetical protein
MSTPGVAAAATLVRQYFMDGFYPTGVHVITQAYKGLPACVPRPVPIHCVTQLMCCDATS